MGKYENQYYFLRKPEDDEMIPSLSPDDNTCHTSYDFDAVPFESPPFVFFNGGREYNQKKGVPSLKKIPQVLFDGSNLLIPGFMREALLELDISDLHMHPAIYVHDDGKWYEDYWYMTFINRFDCWSRLESDYEKDEGPIQLGGFELYEIYTFRFNDELLDSIPQSERLLFKMGGTLNALMVCHESILHIFKSGKAGGVEFVKVGDY